mmetsp:Transcript_14102/g.41364  ORF Transcript_14102/g.41364 Transcript_14102/m.41364 type:complete len:206 (+) Transcript_14102:1242-1859(+)
MPWPCPSTRTPPLPTKPRFSPATGRSPRCPRARLDARWPTPLWEPRTTSPRRSSRPRTAPRGTLTRAPSTGGPSGSSCTSASLATPRSTRRIPSRPAEKSCGGGSASRYPRRSRRNCRTSVSTFCPVSSPVPNRESDRRGTARPSSRTDLRRSSVTRGSPTSTGRTSPIGRGRCSPPEVGNFRSCWNISRRVPSPIRASSSSSRG